MAPSEGAYLKLMSELNLSPQRHVPMETGKGVGSGEKSRGLFCSLACYSKYHAMEYIEKAELINRRMLRPNE